MIPSTLVLFMVALPVTLATVYTQPEQVHLSYGDVPTEMLVTWVTQDYTSGSAVLYGLSGYDQGSNGTVIKFVDGGKLRRTMYIHRAKMTNLKPGYKYMYIVGGQEGWSNRFTFFALKEGTSWSPKMIVFGDMGNDNAQALPLLQQDAQQGNFDIILHVGDFAYDMDTDDALVGDEFMRQIEPVAGYVPYMTCPGNHENAYNFSNYRNRFTMPGGDGTGMYYSWNIGPAHIVSFNTEIYWWDDTHDNIKRQYDWVEADLQEANRPENRAARPWIITMGHKPMYCSSVDNGELCLNPKNPIRNGTSVFWPNFEDLFYKYGVDVEFYAHEHSYERLWPIYKWKVCNGSYQEPYTNPQAPVHIITGSGGDKEGQTPFRQQHQPFSAFRTDDYGWTVMDVVNKTHLSLKEVSINKGGKIIDNVWLIKSKHGAGAYNCFA
ncbi:acid phosphatase type 7-like [Babylonia areolata]|uniref:acid phosphatase type 7-like n=1 Tax=Babylonia areolata TaxID=304850 RepID=UPI003FD24753